MFILEMLNFKISTGEHAPDPPSVLAPSALVPSFAEQTIPYLETYLSTRSDSFNNLGNISITVFKRSVLLF